MKTLLLAPALALMSASTCFAQRAQPHAIVLHAQRMLDVAAGKMVSPGEVLVEGASPDSAPMKVVSKGFESVPQGSLA